MIIRDFLPGEEWVYYKIYCPYISADEILLTIENHMVNCSCLNTKIDKWFFIRYNDPDYHLRLRVKLKDVDYLGFIVVELSKIFRLLYDCKKIISCSMNIYEREIEKYDAKTISYFENISCLDSALAISILRICKNNQEAFFLNALIITDCYLSSFDYTTNQKLKFCASRRDYFKEEFNSDSATRKSLKVKYEGLEDKIHHFLLRPKNKLILNFENDLKLDIKHILAQDDQDAKLSQKFLINLIHLHINRLFIRNQRKYEFVCFDVLSRYYATEIYKSSTK